MANVSRDRYVVTNALNCHRVSWRPERVDHEALGSRKGVLSKATMHVAPHINVILRRANLCASLVPPYIPVIVL